MDMSFFEQYASLNVAELKMYSYVRLTQAHLSPHFSSSWPMFAFWGDHVGVRNTCLGFLGPSTQEVRLGPLVVPFYPFFGE